MITIVENLEKEFNMLDEFPRLTSRLAFIELSSDQLKNLDIYICLHELESYIYGAVSQYSRIMGNVPEPLSGTLLSHSLNQLKLDIYYYTLTWDKLKKVFAKFKVQISNVMKPPNALPTEFKHDFRLIRTRLEHLFRELSTSVRNEYEHPSLRPTKIGNMVGFGNSSQDAQGNIKAHVGNDEFAIVKKEHTDRLLSLWIELIDIFVKHLTDKASSSEILLLKREIEENIDELIATYLNYRNEKKVKDANQIFQQILMSELYLSSEGIPLRGDIREKVYSFLAQRKETQ